LRQSVSRRASAADSLEAKTTRKRIQITVETERVLVIRSNGRSRRWCVDCGRDVDVVNFVQAAALTGIAQPRLSTGTETKKWHGFEDPDGTPFICLESLLKSM
jgi:hypothetical protein